MKLLIRVLLSILLLPELLAAQVVFDTEKKQVNRFPINASFYVALGLIDPTEINQFIASDIERKYGSVIYTIGTSDITTAATFNFALAGRVNQYLEVRLPLEYGGATKEIAINSSRERYAINRVSVGLLADGYFEAESGAFIFGGGPLYHALWFQTDKGNNLGLRLQLGYSIWLNNYHWDILFVYDRAKAATSARSPNEIDLSGPGLGMRITFQ